SCATGRPAHAPRGDGVRCSGRARYKRAVQGPRGTLRHTGRGPAGAAADQDAARRAAVRRGGAVTPRVEIDTPFMQQYHEIKARYPHAILFFRMGDFYALFEDAARLAARQLGWARAEPQQLPCRARPGRGGGRGWGEWSGAGRPGPDHWGVGARDGPDRGRGERAGPLRSP